MSYHKKMIAARKSTKYNAFMTTFCQAIGIKTEKAKGDLHDNLSIVVQIMLKVPEYTGASERVKRLLTPGNLDVSLESERIDMKWLAGRWVKQDGMNLKNVSDHLQNNFEIVMWALDQNPKSFQYASQRLRDSGNVASKAVRLDGLNLKWVGEYCKKSEHIIVAALQQNPESKAFILEEMKKNKTVKEALKRLIS